MTQSRNRRTTEQKIADLESAIANLKAKAAKQQLKANPAIRHTTSAIKSIDKALAEADTGSMRRALQEARTTLSALLAMDGVVVASSSTSRIRRSAVNLEEMSESLLTHVAHNPGQRGEQIAAALGTDVTTMRRPMKQLIADRKIKTKGQRRGMCYFATN